MEAPVSLAPYEASFVPISHLPSSEPVMELAAEAYRRFKFRSDKRNQQIYPFGGTPGPFGVRAAMNSVHRRAQELCDGDQGY
jgi:hypothetical protein